MNPSHSCSHDRDRQQSPRAATILRSADRPGPQRVGNGKVVESSFALPPSNALRTRSVRGPFRGRQVALRCVLLLLLAWRAGAVVNEVNKLSPGVYFHEGDLKGHGHCNNGWIVFEDFVLVIDANFPSGAMEILPKIKASSERPVRFAFDTHHHGDHAYGNLFWVENGAVPVAHTGVLQEMMKYETGYYGSKPGRWEEAAKTRKDVAGSRLKPPPLLYETQMIFDDGRRRVELLHFGVAHTHGDGFAWLPKEKILFTGDACVNGPYNYTGDGDIEQWIRTLAAAEKLGAKTVCPGHGPVAGGELLADQKNFFIALRKQVKKHWRSKPAEMKARVEAIREAVLKEPRIAKYVGEFFPAQVEKAYTEMGGKVFPEAKTAADQADQHARQ
jgi:cyclase